MDREHIKMAMLKQEQTFRQQVNELHRLYQVQRQLMRDMQIVEMNQAQASINTKTRTEAEILHNDKATDHQRYNSYSDRKMPPSLEDFDLELTLATGSSRSRQTKQGKYSNSDSGTTVSSTSTEPELAQLRDSDATLRFQTESMRHDELTRSPWLHQCLSLRMA